MHLHVVTGLSPLAGMKKILLLFCLFASACHGAIDGPGPDAASDAEDGGDAADADTPDSGDAADADTPDGDGEPCVPACAGVLCGADDGCGQPCAEGTGCTPPTVVTVTYTVDSTTNFANPERGFYRHRETQSSGYVPLDSVELTAMRTQQGISLVLRLWYLADFVAGDFDQTFLDRVSADFDAIRAAGVKTIVRFGYSDSELDSPRDTTKAQILRHIEQLRPILETNADIIAVVEAGFVGVWGEWYYTDHFGDLGVISPAQWVDRQEVVEALLGVGPRPVLLRTPLFKTTMYGSEALGPTEAFDGSARARVGHHNDCFLASDTDYGTYIDIEAQKAYLAQETRYVPLGGETCAVSAYSGWANASAEMTRLHWSFLNIDYHSAVLSSWGADIEEAKRRLGYRLALVEGRLPASVAPGADLTISLSLRNDGYAAPFNPRAVTLVLSEVGSGIVHELPLSAEPRLWAPGTAIEFSQTLSLAGIPAGSYELSLSLPDPSPDLRSRPEYAIRLANQDTWEAAAGTNRLNHTLTVAP